MLRNLHLLRCAVVDVFKYLDMRGSHLSVFAYKLYVGWQRLALAAYSIVVGRKGISVDFLPKLSAEIRQKVFLCLSGLSVFLQKGSLSAERISFGRKAHFRQKATLSVGISVDFLPKF